MNEEYRRKLLARLLAAWPESDSRPVDIAALDGRSWLVTYQSVDGTTFTAPLLKRALRAREREQVFHTLSSMVFRTGREQALSFTGSEKEEQHLRRLVRSSVSGVADSSVKVLAAFVDTLVLNVYSSDSTFEQTKGRVALELQEELTLLKEQAQEQEEDIATRFTFAGVPLNMTRKGAEGFQWILRSSKLSLAVNRGSKMQLLAQVRCSSEYLWSVRDLGKIVTDVHFFLMSIFGEQIILQPSAIDLACDVAGLDFWSLRNVKEHFVTRAQLSDERPLDMQAVIDGPDAIKQRWDRLTGLPFGARAGALSTLIYDKTHRIKYSEQEKEWFLDIYRSVCDTQGNPLWDGSSPVWRIEVRWRRPGLNELKGEDFHGLNDAYDLEAKLPGLWCYAVGHPGGGADGLPDGWLRYVMPTEDSNRSRWPVHPDWEVIQSGFVPVPLEESVYEQEEREKEELLQEVDAELAARPFVTSSIKRHRSRSRPAVPVPAPAPAPLPEPASLDVPAYIRKRKYQANMRRMVGQILGCMITAEAWRASVEHLEGAAPDLSGTFHFLYDLAEDYLQEMEENRKMTFSELVQKKRLLYSIESAAAETDADRDFYDLYR